MKYKYNENLMRRPLIATKTIPESFVPYEDIDICLSCANYNSRECIGCHVNNGHSYSLKWEPMVNIEIRQLAKEECIEINTTK